MPDTCFLQYIQQNKIYMVTAVTYLIGVYLTGLMRLEEAHQPHCQSRREEPSLGLVSTGRFSPTACGILVTLAYLANLGVEPNVFTVLWVLSKCHLKRLNN